MSVHDDNVSIVFNLVDFKLISVCQDTKCDQCLTIDVTQMTEVVVVG